MTIYWLEPGFHKITASAGGHRIATIAHNHWHTTVQYFAAWLLGLVVISINLEEEII